MLETTPRGTSEISLHRMEIHVHLGGEEIGNHLEGTNGGVRGRTQMAEYHGGFYMDSGTQQGNAKLSAPSHNQK